MLRPTKHSHPDKTVVALSVLLLRRLSQRRVESFDDLRLVAKSGGSDLLFLPALNLLFVLGLVEYHPKIDSFEYIGPA